MKMARITFENYLRQQAEKSQYGVTVIQTQIALDIADWIEKNRQRTEVIKCEECPFDGRLRRHMYPHLKKDAEENCEI